MSNSKEDQVHLFYQDVLSNWAMLDFVVKDIKYNCVEQFMMAAKARLMGDAKTLNAIMAAKTPREHKKLGRSVKNFDEKKWQQARARIVAVGLMAKFRQNSEAREHLLKTKGLIAEASPWDCIWGIGLGINNPKAKDPSQWRGQNLLGELLTKVRDKLKSENA